MRKTVLGLAVGALTLALAAEAEACRIARRDYVPPNGLWALVHSASQVELARVVEANLLPTADRQFGPGEQTYRYEFETIETLAGDSVSGFEYLGRSPVEGIAEIDCADVSELQGYGDTLHHDLNPELAYCEAENSHRDWPALRYRIIREGMDGVGIVPASPELNHSDRIIVGCGGVYTSSLIVGEAYLVFRDANGEIVNGWGQNLQLIRRDNDIWLEMVRLFLANDEATRFPSISAEIAASWLLDVDAENVLCQSGPPCELPTNYFQVQYREIAEQASRGPASISLPMRDGMVDLGHLPTIYQIEPQFVPIDELRSWLADPEANQ